VSPPLASDLRLLAIAPPPSIATFETGALARLLCQIWYWEVWTQPDQCSGNSRIEDWPQSVRHWPLHAMTPSPKRCRNSVVPISSLVWRAFSASQGEKAERGHEAARMRDWWRKRRLLDWRL